MDLGLPILVILFAFIVFIICVYIIQWVLRVNHIVDRLDKIIKLLENPKGEMK